MTFKRAHAALLIATTWVLLVAPAQAALSSYMELTDEPAGTPIMGGSSISGREGQVEVYELHHLMEVPGGQTAVDHQTIIVTVPLNDPSIPVLLQKMDTNGLVGVVLHLWELNGGGSEINYVDITLTDAKVVSFEPLSADPRVPETLGLDGTARIRLTYATIDFNNIGAGLNQTLTNSGN